MVVTCVASGCRNTLGDRFQFHRFPHNRPEILKLWVIAVNRENWEPSKHSRLCSAHFHERDYSINPTAKKLESDAVPSIFTIRKAIPKRRELIRSSPRQPTSQACTSAVNNSYLDLLNSLLPQLNEWILDTDVLTRTADKCVQTSQNNFSTQKQMRHKIKILNQNIRRQKLKMESMKLLIRKLKRPNAHPSGLEVISNSKYVCKI